MNLPCKQRDNTKAITLSLKLYQHHHTFNVSVCSMHIMCQTVLKCAVQMQHTGNVIDLRPVDSRHTKNKRTALIYLCDTAS